MDGWATESAADKSTIGQSGGQRGGRVGQKRHQAFQPKRADESWASATGGAEARADVRSSSGQVAALDFLPPTD